jgi:hypothetical protein
MPNITHSILGYNPFTVEFINLNTGRTTIERYQVPLTKKEIEAEYDYVTFLVAPAIEDVDVE